MMHGDVIRSKGRLLAVAERNPHGVIAFPCMEENGTLTLQPDTAVYLSQVELPAAEIVGSLNAEQLEQTSRQLVFRQVRDYYRRFHQESTFVPQSSRVPYAGKCYDDREMVALADAALDFWLTSGRFTRRFESELARYLGMRYVLLTNSGSSANLLAVSALTSPKLKERALAPGDEIITAAAGFPTTVAPIVQNRLVPVFVDAELDTCNIRTDLIEPALTPRTKAIMVAHTMGNPFRVDEVLRLAKQYNLWVIEDNCDALGSTYGGKLTGTFGDIGTSSFYPAHHITMGEGGAVYTNHPLLKTILESFRDWGRDCWCASGCDNTCSKRFGWQLGDLPYGYDHKYTYSHLGYNLKATDLQAAIGLEQLGKLPDFVQRRIDNFRRLREGLRELEDKLMLPEATPNSSPSWFGFVMTIRDGSRYARDRIMRYLEERGIQTRPLFAGNLIRQPAFAGVAYRLGSSLDATDKIMRDTFLVGVYPGLSPRMIDYMIDSIKDAFAAADA
ncbi:MAG: lipopolysaccharide biosynthesis protein RfbH [Paenibacillaceae bacterium]|nr:lipopolysaccharide biosynthesis protein RfbH [Paenibacillaceae bacterium]